LANGGNDFPSKDSQDYGALNGLESHRHTARSSETDCSTSWRKNLPKEWLAGWDCPTLAKQLGGSTHAVWRLLRKEGIYLHRARSWCISTDPEFATKAANIVGLYLNPPLNALVLSVDEKPSIQAIERETGFIETRDKKVYRGYKSMYKRHGTLNLFAALNVAS